jgi:hypothetical protein
MVTLHRLRDGSGGCAGEGGGVTHREPSGIVLEEKGNPHLIDLPPGLRVTAQLDGETRVIVLRMGRGILLPKGTED